MKMLSLEEALEIAGHELGWQDPNQKLRFALRVIHANVRLMCEAGFRRWLCDQICKRRNRLGLGPRGDGTLVIRSRKLVNYSPTRRIYWNKFLGWRPGADDATLYTDAELKSMNIPEGEAFAMKDPITFLEEQMGSAD